jgi:hypothetical protein
MQLRGFHSVSSAGMLCTNLYGVNATRFFLLEKSIYAVKLILEILGALQTRYTARKNIYSLGIDE